MIVMVCSDAADAASALRAQIRDALHREVTAARERPPGPSSALSYRWTQV